MGKSAKVGVRNLVYAKLINDAIAVAGSNTYTITTNAIATDTVKINNVTLTAIASGASTSQFNIGVNTTETAVSLATALNANTIISALYTATSNENVITLTEKTAGSGNTPGTATAAGAIVIASGTPVNSAGGVSYAVPKAFSKVKTATIKPNTDTATDYADDGPSEIASSLGEINIDLEMSALSLEEKADLLGHTVTAGVMTSKSSDSAPYVAIGFKSKKANGKYRYSWLLKTQFAEPEDSNKTLGDKVEFQSETLSGKAVTRTYDGAWKKETDEDAAGFVEETAVGWFTAATINAPTV